MNDFLLDTVMFGVLAVVLGVVAVLAWGSKSYAAAVMYGAAALLIGALANMALGLWSETTEGKVEDDA